MLIENEIENHADQAAAMIKETKVKVKSDFHFHLKLTLGPKFIAEVTCFFFIFKGKVFSA